MENNGASLHVRLWEPGLRLLKTLLGRGNPIRQGPRGKEEWYQDGSAGGLLVRKVDVSWLQAQMRGLGAEFAIETPVSWPRSTLRCAGGPPSGPSMP